MNSADISEHRQGGALAVFRRYVCDFVNRHDFAALPQIMTEDYALLTAGHEIRGRDGAYRAAVAHQLEQFPGLLYTIHEIHAAPEAVAVRFSEHGASNKHKGSTAVWSSIAIYHSHGDKLASCSIEQDFYSRRRQLEEHSPLAVAAPAIAPWDTCERAAKTASENVVRTWVEHPDWLYSQYLAIDDGDPDQRTPELEQESIELLDIVSSSKCVTFRAVQRGRVSDDLLRRLELPHAPISELYLAGMVSVAHDRVVSGHVVRDRMGLHKRLRQPSR